MIWKGSISEVNLQLRGTKDLKCKYVVGQQPSFDALVQQDSRWVRLSRVSIPAPTFSSLWLRGETFGLNLPPLSIKTQNMNSELLQLT